MIERLQSEPSVFHYRIHEYLSRVPQKELEVVINSLVRVLKISEQRFYEYYLSSKAEEVKIPTVHLLKIARFFGGYFSEPVELEDLLCFAEEEKVTQIINN